MNYEIHKKWGGGGAGCLFLLLFLATSGALAQTRYIDPVHGIEDGDCTSSDPAAASDGPCTLTRAFVSANQTADAYFPDPGSPGGWHGGDSCTDSFPDRIHHFWYLCPRSDIGIFCGGEDHVYRQIQGRH